MANFIAKVAALVAKVKAFISAHPTLTHLVTALLSAAIGHAL